MITTLHAPGPKRSFITGNMNAFRRNPIRFLTQCARDYGDITRFKIGPQEIFFANHPDLIKDVLVTHHRNFVKGRGGEYINHCRAGLPTYAINRSDNALSAQEQAQRSFWWVALSLNRVPRSRRTGARRSTRLLPGLRDYEQGFGTDVLMIAVVEQRIGHLIRRAERELTTPERQDRCDLRSTDDRRHGHREVVVIESGDVRWAYPPALPDNPPIA